MFSPMHSMHRTMLLEAIEKRELGKMKPAVYKPPSKTDYSERGNYEMSIDKEELKKRLTPMQYSVTQEHGTEQAFSGEYYRLKDDGLYHCVACNAVLFRSEEKYDSGSGWPSFYDLAEKGSVKLHRDSTHGMVRTECVCAKIILCSSSGEDEQSVLFDRDHTVFFQSQYFSQKYSFPIVDLI